MAVRVVSDALRPSCGTCNHSLLLHTNDRMASSHLISIRDRQRSRASVAAAGRYTTLRNRRRRRNGGIRLLWIRWTLFWRRRRWCRLSMLWRH